jgi:hypothetical protein
MTPVEPVRHLRGLLTGAGRYPRLAEEALRIVRAQPGALLPEVVALANQEAAGAAAAALLGRLLAEDPRLDLAADVYACCPVVRRPTSRRWRSKSRRGWWPAWCDRAARMPSWREC